MQLVLAQKDCQDTDYRKWLTQAAALAPDLIVLGELSTSGCLYEPREFEPIETVIAEAERIRRPVILGTPRRDGEYLRNCAVYVDGDSVQIYDKVNLFPPMNEPSVYQPGTKTGIFETRFGRIGIAICYDLRFENLFAEMAEQSVAMAVVPAAFPLVRIDAWRRLLVERATTFGLTVVGVNAVGDDGVNRFGGSTMVVGPNGELIVQADTESPGLIEVELSTIAAK